MFDINNPEPGCYVDGSWGQYADVRLIEQFADLCLGKSDAATAKKNAKLFQDGDTTNSTYDKMLGFADEIEDCLNRNLPGHLSTCWVDGEFFIIDENDGEFDPR